MSCLSAQALCAGYDQRLVVDNLTISLPTGKITAIVGANGSGKSTLLKTFARILQPTAGRVYLDQDELHALPTRSLARRLSILPQNSHAPESLTVGELVAYGRYPHRRWLQGANDEDIRMVAWALEVTGIDAFKDRPVNSLSGGQQQRAWIAMTLAQGADVLLLDEPTSHLDTCHQLEVMELLSKLHRNLRKTVVMVLHDLNLAARYADQILALKDGRIVAAGSPEEVMTEGMLQSVFSVASCITSDPRTGSPLCITYLSA